MLYGGGVRRVMVVVDAAQAGSTLEVVAVVDDGAAGTMTGTVLGVPIVGGTDLVAAWRDDGRIDGVIVGIGDNHTRLAVAERLAGSVPGVVLEVVVHPTASAASARLDAGAVVLAGCRLARRPWSPPTACSAPRPTWTTTPRWPPDPAWARVRSPAARSASAGRLRWRWGRSFVTG